jgi:hypothetical protein
MIEKTCAIVTGEAAINAWDQGHAEALNRLRHCDAFVLVTWPDFESLAELALLAKEGGKPVTMEMLVQAAHGIAEAATDIAALEDA